MAVQIKYLSSGVNQTPHGIDWGPDGTVCCAASTGVLLCDPQNGAMTGASTQLHTKKVTSVRWVQPVPTAGRVVISSGADGKAVVWTVSHERTESLHTLNPCSVLEHEDSVSLVDATLIVKEGKEKIFVITVTMDQIFSWLGCVEAGKFERLNVAATPGNAYALSLRLFDIPGAKYPILALGGHDSKIHILTASELGMYQPSCVLTGHEDWVTSLDVMKEDDGGLLLASGSKDATVRLWRLSTGKNINHNQESDLTKSKELRLKSIVFKIPTVGEDIITMSVLLDAVLAGHEGMVSEVYWARPMMKGDELHQSYKLLTCSKTQDRSIILWEPEEATSCGMWLEVARLGEVGGNMEGYYSSQLSPDGSQVLACSYQGGLHLWQQQKAVWEPCVVAGGHFNQVADISWDPSGMYLLSASKDQTTRLHAAWKKGESEVVWHEVSRPQVHGHDLACITTLGKYKFSSGAEEKVLRGFTAPANFIRNFGTICSIDVQEDLAKCDIGEGASVPSLGLSNKAVTIADLQEEHQQQVKGEEEVQAYFKPLSLSAPPTEDQLMQNTLWPEAAKLYGHGNDLFAIAASSDGSLLASSCKAATNADAGIIIWDTTTWHKVDTLAKHRLTVTQLAFSPDDQHLLSVSRDRTWAIFTRTVVNSDAGFTYKLSDSSSKKETMHSRVIWSCAWLPNSSHFVTASRDKTVAVWGMSEAGWRREALATESDEVTAVAVTKYQTSHCVLVATGLVGGDIHIRKYNLGDATFSTEVVPVVHKHHDTVRRLQFRPVMEDDINCVYLASCSNDMKVQIYEINM